MVYSSLDDMGCGSSEVELAPRTRLVQRAFAEAKLCSKELVQDLGLGFVLESQNPKQP